MQAERHVVSLGARGGQTSTNLPQPVRLGDERISAVVLPLMITIPTITTVVLTIIINGLPTSLHAIFKRVEHVSSLNASLTACPVIVVPCRKRLD